MAVCGRLWPSCARKNGGRSARSVGLVPGLLLSALQAWAVLEVLSSLGTVLAAGNSTATDPDAATEAPSVWQYISIPFVSALVGWGTNVVALKMTFYPIEFMGININRYACGKDQPVGCIGWQGIIPAKAPVMAAKSVDLMTRDLFKIEELFARLEPADMAHALAPGAKEMLTTIVSEVAGEHMPSIWEALPIAVQEEVVARAVEEEPEFVTSFFRDLQANLEELFDLKDMVVTHLTEHKEQLNELFLRCGDKELSFIARSGAYFGFIFGLIQMVIWILLPEWWIMPAAGFVVGYLTNFLALKMIFEPIHPVTVCGYEIQGLFLKRQVEVSAEFAKMQAESLLTSRNMWTHMLTGPLSGAFNARLRKHSIVFTEKLLGPVKMIVLLYLGAPGFKALKEHIADRVVEELPNNIKYLHDYTDRMLDMERTLRERMSALPPDKFEGVLHPAFQEDELKLILVGAALGVMVGFFQVFVVFAE